MEHPAIRILNANRIMSISTLRPDGWPQTTVVGYVNRGFDLYFVIFKSSQKFANIRKDDRISIAVAPEPAEISELQAVYASARAVEITDTTERDEVWRWLMQRHANLSGFSIPSSGESAFMRARCQNVSVLDYTQGIGHHEQLALDDKGVKIGEKLTKDGWGKSREEGETA